MQLLTEAEYMAATGFTLIPAIGFRSGLGPYRHSALRPAEKTRRQPPRPSGYLQKKWRREHADPRFERRGGHVRQRTQAFGIVGPGPGAASARLCPGFGSVPAPWLAPRALSCSWINISRSSTVRRSSIASVACSSGRFFSCSILIGASNPYRAASRRSIATAARAAAGASLAGQSTGALQCGQGRVGTAALR